MKIIKDTDSKGNVTSIRWSVKVWELIVFFIILTVLWCMFK